MAVEWEKEVKPDGGVSEVYSYGKFSELFETSFGAPYDPLTVAKMLSGEAQEIVVRPAVPLFLFSPRTRVYLAEDVVKFRGYLSEFKPDLVGEDGEPEAEVTITVV